MPFSSALKNFYEDGFFELTHSQILYENIYCIQKRIQHLKKDKHEIRIYQIYLSNIAVISGPLPRERQDRLLSDQTDIVLTPMDSTRGLNASFNSIDQEETREIQLVLLKGALISLFVQSDTWRSIELDHVFFHKNQQIDDATTESFYSGLLNSLAQNNSLRELTIKPFSLSKYQKSLVNFLAQNTELEFLSLQITEVNREDWLELCKILSTHPKLQHFHLGNSLLDANAYSALARLLDENYRIEISLPEPLESHLLEAYQPLKQRLSKPGLERFKADHLSQDKLLHVAVTALESIQRFKATEQIKKQVLFEKQFNFLVANQGHLAITRYQKEAWVKNANVLPPIYQSHKEYLKDQSSLVQLQMSELVADQNKTIGYVLMEKVLETQNSNALEILLNANVNLFEFPDNDEEPFIVKIFQSKKDLKRIVVEHIQRDPRLTKMALEYLAAYPNLRGLFKEFKAHLEGYGSHFVKKNNLSMLLTISKKILTTWGKILDLENPSEARGKEFERIYLDLDKNLQIIDYTLKKISYDSFDSLHEIIIKMKGDSIKTLRNFINSSLLHEEILELIYKFETELLDTKQIIVHETIKNKDEELTQVKESHGKERFVFNEQFTKLKLKQTKLEAENTEIKIKQTIIEEKLNVLLVHIETIFNSETAPNPSDSHRQISAQTRGFFLPQTGNSTPEYLGPMEYTPDALPRP